MEKRIDLIGIGECLIEFNSTGNALYQLGYSGDVLNVLSSARRLGLTTGLISAIGDDPFGPGLREVLLEEQIDLSHTPLIPGKPNGVYFINLDDYGVPSFHFLRKDSAATEAFTAQPLGDLIDYVKSARALLFSSIPLAVMKETERLFHVLDAAKGETLICFDLNIRAALWPEPAALLTVVKRLAPIVDVLFVTNDDDQYLFGDRDPERALAEYQSFGFTQVVYRRGAEKTLVADRSETFAVPVPRAVNVVDTTGAGDAFNAGFIAAMLRRHPSYECAAMGNATAACSLETRGGRGTGISIERVEKHYRPLVKWGTFHVPHRR